MTFSELAKERYSCRKFSTKQVEKEKLDQILETGRMAPSAKNLQPWHVFVLQSEEAITKIRSLARCAFNAPVVLLVCGRQTEAWENPFNGRNGAEMDASIITTHMILQAKELGLDTTWVCWFDTALVKKEFNLPEDLEPYVLIPLGYADESAKPSPNHEARKDIKDIVTYL